MVRGRAIVCLAMLPTGEMAACERQGGTRHRIGTQKVQNGNWDEGRREILPVYPVKISGGTYTAAACVTANDTVGLDPGLS